MNFNTYLTIDLIVVINFLLAAEGSLKADYEIQQWGAELVKSRDEGGVGILVGISFLSFHKYPQSIHLKISTMRNI